MITGSKEMIRDINSSLVLQTILNKGPLSRAALSKEVGLTKATISAIVQELLDRRLVLEIGSKDTAKGRKPILLKFHQKAGHALAIDLGVNEITVMAADLCGESCILRQYPNNTNAADLTDTLLSHIRQMQEALPESIYGIVGIAIGIHGIVHNNNIDFTPYYAFEHSDLKEKLEKALNVTVFIENEANLSVIGEKTFCYNYQNMINISVHSGIGLGLLLQGELYTGVNGFAGEFGHSIVEMNGRPCPCGNLGCFEQYASERSLMKEYAALKNLEKTDFNAFLRDYQAKDPDASFILEQFIQYMSVGINNILNIFNPELIVINSSFTTFLPGLTEQIEKRIQNKISAFCRVVPSGLQDTAILLGGCCICIKSFLGVPSLEFTR